MAFIKKHPCIAVSIVGLFAILLDLLIEQFAELGGAMCFIFLFLISFFPLLGIFVLIFNIIAMIAVLKDKPAAGVILSLPFGGLGAAIGLLFNPSYEYKIAVKIIFSIQLWLVIWVFASLIILQWG